MSRACRPVAWIRVVGRLSTIWEGISDVSPTGPRLSVLLWQVFWWMSTVVRPPQIFMLNTGEIKQEQGFTFLHMNLLIIRMIYVLYSLSLSNPSCQSFQLKSLSNTEIVDSDMERRTWQRSSITHREREKSPLFVSESTPTQQIHLEIGIQKK